MQTSMFTLLLHDLEVKRGRKHQILHILPSAAVVTFVAAMLLIVPWEL